MTSTELPQRIRSQNQRVIPTRSVRHPNGSDVGSAKLTLAGISPEAARALIVRLSSRPAA